MARPIRNNAEFFYHPANLRDDRRIKAMRAKFGPVGYAILLMLLESLTNADFTHLDTSEIELELLSGDYGVSATEIDSLIQFAERVGYFARDTEEYLICPDLNKALEPVFEKRNRSRNLVNATGEQPKPDFGVVSVTETPITVTETTHNKIEYSTVNESTEDESKVNATDNNLGVGEKSDPASVPLKTLDKETNPLPDQEMGKEKSSAKKEKGFITNPDGSVSCIELREELLEYRKNHPDKYTDEIYIAFLHYWSQPNDSQVPLWKLQKKKKGTFHVPGRLITWNSNNSINDKSNGKSNNQRKPGSLYSTAKAPPEYRGLGTTCDVEL